MAKKAVELEDKEQRIIKDALDSVASNARKAVGQAKNQLLKQVHEQIEKEALQVREKFS